nr:hypothetical protein CFP56_44451 [Quercus suber]
MRQQGSVSSSYLILINLIRLCRTQVKTSDTWLSCSTLAAQTRCKPSARAHSAQDWCRVYCSKRACLIAPRSTTRLCSVETKAIAIAEAILFRGRCNDFCLYLFSMAPARAS